MKTPQTTLQPENLLKPGEVARMFHVDVKTIARWAKEGQLPHVLLPSGHRRYRPDEIAALITKTRQEARS